MNLRAPKSYLLSCAALAVLAPALFLAQSTAPSTDSRLPRGTDPSPRPATPKPGPNLTAEQQERFLLSARIVAMRDLTEGTTRSHRATMSDGKLTHDAHIQLVDVYKPVFRGKEGTVEKDFRDSWKYNVAGYRLAKTLGIEEMVPVSVERSYNNKPASFTWWVDNVWMDEAKRRDDKIKPPTADFWTNQLNKVRVFDALIYNTDRNQGNLLITHDWRLWMIDHTRAFRSHKTLFRPDTLSRCDETVFDRLKKLDRGSLQLALGKYLTPPEIEGILARRDLIVRFFENEIREKGSDAVLTGLPRKTPVVSVP